MSLFGHSCRQSTSDLCPHSSGPYTLAFSAFSGPQALPVSNTMTKCQKCSKLYDLSCRALFSKSNSWSWSCDYFTMVPCSKKLEIHICNMQHGIVVLQLFHRYLPNIFLHTINTLFPLRRPGSWFGQSFKPSTSNSCLDGWGLSTSVSVVSSGSPS